MPVHRLLLLVAFALVPLVAFGQPLASDPPVQADRTPLRLAVVMEQAAVNDGCGSSSSGSSCDGADCSPDGADCGSNSDGGGIACLALTGCAALAGGVAYGIYRIVQRRRAPDSLAASAATALERELGAHVQIVSPEVAEVVVTVREVETRQGVGIRARERRLMVTARDRAGRPLALDDGPLPSPHLVLSVPEAGRPEMARRLASRLARGR